MNFVLSKDTDSGTLFFLLKHLFLLSNTTSLSFTWKQLELVAIIVYIKLGKLLF